MEIEAPKPNVLGSTRSSITLSWRGTDNQTEAEGHDDENSRPQYTLHMKDRIRGWITVYWGFRTEYEVTGLGPQECYQFRLKVKIAERESDWSPTLAATTKEDQIAIVNLYRAIQYGQPKNAKKILTSRYGSVEIFNSMGMSPLMQATSRGDPQMVTLLLSAGADVNVTSEAAGRTALMIACFKGEAEIARHLREKGAKYDIKDRSGCTALHYAVDASQMETMLLALDEGADIESKDNEEWTPLMRGVVLESSLPILQKLLERGALVNAADRRDQTCLMQAVLSGREDVVKLLVDSGADLTSSNMYHNTALDMARARELKDILPYLSPKSTGLRQKKWKRIIKEKM